MKTINFSNGRVYEVPETWTEAEEMITKELRYDSGRGFNGRVQSVCARIAYGLLSEQSMTPDPTTALAHVFQRICQRRGAGLER